MGPHIYQTCPSANYFDCKAMAIGARSQVSFWHTCKSYCWSYTSKLNSKLIVPGDIHAIEGQWPILKRKNSAMSYDDDDDGYFLEQNIAILACSLEQSGPGLKQVFKTKTTFIVSLFNVYIIFDYFL